MECPQCYKRIDLFDNYTFYYYNPHTNTRIDRILCSKECQAAFGLKQDSLVLKYAKYKSSSDSGKLLDLEIKLAYEIKQIAKHTLTKTELEMCIFSLKEEYELE